MENNNIPQWANDLQMFFKDIANGVYGERIKELFMQEESSE